MEKETEEYKLRKFLYDIQRRPGVICMANNEKKLVYLFYFLFGWSMNSKEQINDRYCKGISHWIYKSIIASKCNNVSEIDFTFHWYKLIYHVTRTEEEAWDLFFKLSHEYLDQLETEEN